MAKLICKLQGVRGRTMYIYDTKAVIQTAVTVGSILTSNATDGEKTIFYSDCTGIQFKESGLAIGYLQLETPSMQMNNQSSNFFSENTFTYENGKNGLTNELMRAWYNYLADRMESIKYGTEFTTPVPEVSTPAPAPAQAPVQAPGTAKFCTHCGGQLNGSGKFCPKCGAPV